MCFGVHLVEGCAPFYCPLFPFGVFFGSIWDFFPHFPIKHVTDYVVFTNFVAPFDTGYAGERPGTERQANKHAPNELPYLFVLRGFFLLTTNK